MLHLYQTPQQPQNRNIRAAEALKNIPNTQLNNSQIVNSECHYTANTTQIISSQQEKNTHPNKLKEQSIIDWINSFNDPYCLLVNSMKDLKDGIALCHLVGFITCSPSDQTKMRQLIYYNCDSDSQNLIYSNLELALNVLKSSSIPIPITIQEMTVQTLFEENDEESYLEILETLKSTYEIMNVNFSEVQQQPLIQEKQPIAKNSFSQEYSASLCSETSIQNTLKVQEQQHQQKIKNQNGIFVPNLPINMINLNKVQNDEQEEQIYHIKNDKYYQQRNNQNTLNLPLQIGNTEQNYQLNEDLLDYKYYNALELNNISPINAKQPNYPYLNNDDQFMQRSLQEEYLNKQEEVLQEEINQLNSLNEGRSNTSKVINAINGVQQQDIVNISTQTKSNYSNSSNRIQQKHKFQQKQIEKQDYQRVIQNSVKKLQNSNIRDPAVGILNKSPISSKKTPNQIHNQQQEQELTPQQETRILQYQKNPKNNNLTDTAVEQGKSDIQNKNVQLRQKLQKQTDQEEEQVMNEMQTLNIRPENKEGKQDNSILEIKVDKVDMKIKIKIIEWLYSEVKLIRSKSEKLINEFAHYCRNGVLFFDLINRLGGRNNILKGIERNPKNMTSVQSNFAKVLEYLRQFSRFCPRYLWAQNLLIQGNEDVIWGLLDDIWYWHFNKISPFDPTSKIQQKQMKDIRESMSPVLKQQQKHKQLQQYNTVSPIQNKKPFSQQQQDITSDQQTLTIMEDVQKMQQDQIRNKNLPPRSNRYQGVLQQQQDQINNVQDAHLKKIQIQTKYNNNNQCESIDATTPLTLRQSATQSKLNSVQRDKSYSSMHRNQDSLKSPQKSAYSYLDQKNQNYQQKHQNSVMSRQNRSFSNSRRKDIKYSNTPIAKDEIGTFYYNNDSKVQDSHECLSFLLTNQTKDNKFQQVIQITERIEAEVNEWLFKIKFHQFLSKEYIHQDIFHDPVRNGVFLSELICYLERIDMYNIITEPKTINECKENLQKVMSVLKQKRKDLPSKLLGDNVPEQIMKRDKQTLYSILYFLKSQYPEMRPLQSQLNINTSINTINDKQNLSHQSLNLPYTEGEIRMLEISLINWIKSIGIIFKLGKDSDLQIDSMIQLQKEVTNGTLVCELIQTLFNCKLPGGYFRDPKTDSTCISNIRKSLEYLRNQGKMSQKFTWAEKEIFEGKIHVILGLLEDLHRCFDGIPPRKRGATYFSDGPYLGDTLYNEQPYIKYKIKQQQQQEPLRDSQKHKFEGITQLKPKQSPKTIQNIEKDVSNIEQTIELNAINKFNKFEEIPSLFSQRNNYGENNSTGQEIRQAFSCLSPANINSNTNQYSKVNNNQNKVNFGNFLNAKIQKEQEFCRSPLKPSNIQVQQQAKPQLFVGSKENKENQEVNPLGLRLNNLVQGQKLSDIISSSYPSQSPSSRLIPSSRSPLSNEERGKKIEFDGKTHVRKPSQTIQIEDYEDEEHELNRNAFNIKEKQKIVDWLHMINIKGIGQDFSLNKVVIEEFKDGVLLCEIVETLEGQKIENIQLRPKSSASCLLNIKKALQILKKKNQIPLYLIYSEEEIHNGNSDIIFQLLKSLRQVYRNKILNKESKYLQVQAIKMTQNILRNSQDYVGNFDNKIQN